MKTFVGVDLGSTTTKAVLLDENREVIGRGITNSRSNSQCATPRTKKNTWAATKNGKEQKRD